MKENDFIPKPYIEKYKIEEKLVSSDPNPAHYKKKLYITIDFTFNNGLTGDPSKLINDINELLTKYLPETRS